MQQNRMQIIALVMIFALMAGGCNNDPAKIGIDIQPDTDKLNVFSSDTTTVYAHSVYVDSVRTDETSRTMIGSYYDPLFGTATSSLNLELRLSTTAIELGDSKILDSMVMVLQYSTVSISGFETLNAYGDTITPQTFRIYELDESIYADSVYYSNSEVALKDGEIASLTFEPHPTDSVTIDTTKYTAQLRIKMNDSFVQKFRDASADDFSSLENFLLFFKGMYIKPDEATNGGAILFFDPSAVFSRMTLYYSNAEEDSLEYYFPITSSSARFMKFEHNYNLASLDFQNQLNGDTTLGQQKFFVQAMAGVASVIEFPYFKDFSTQTNVALNEAKLYISNNNTNDELIPPNELVLFTISNDGSNKVVVDQLEGTEYYGGIYDESNGKYFFRLTQQLQKVLTSDTIPPRFYLGISGASILPKRGVFNGFSPLPGVENSNKLKLELIFTRLNN